jgi:hypothetical protein
MQSAGGGQIAIVPPVAARAFHRRRLCVKGTAGQRINAGRADHDPIFAGHQALRNWFEIKTKPQQAKVAAFCMRV